MSTLLFGSLYLLIVLFGYSLSQPKKASLFVRTLMGLAAPVALFLSIGPSFLTHGKIHLQGGPIIPAIEICICFLGGYYGGRIKDKTSGAGVAIGGFVAGLLVHFLFGRVLFVYGGLVSACETNLKNMGTSLEMYAIDWSGQCPQDLGQLTPNYLRSLPECPAAGEVTYKYVQGPDAPGNNDDHKDYFFLACQGSSHKAAGRPQDFPQYDKVRGLSAIPGGRPPTPWYEWYAKRYY
jgi:hypothetical protein